MKRLGLIIVTLSLIGLILFSLKLISPQNIVSNTERKLPLQTSQQQKKEDPNIGFAAPNFELKALDGNVYSLKEVKGKPIVVNFWASWCTPCKMEAPILSRLYRKYKEKVEIYAINQTNTDSMRGVQTFTNKYQFAFPVLLDRDGKVASLYQIQAIPTTLFINKEGIIQDRFIGIAGPKMLIDGFERLASTGKSQ